MARDDMGSNGAKALDAMGTPRAAFSRLTPPAARAPRAELVRIANMYFSGMQLNDGKGKYPFADDCDRLENGRQTTNAPGRGGQPRPDPKTATSYSAMWSCREQFESGSCTSSSGFVREVGCSSGSVVYCRGPEGRL